jgi:Kinesin motor domain
VLCRLLQTALGGAGETAIIICCSPAIKSAQETLSTLRFGARAQGIVNTVQVTTESAVLQAKLVH